jgi:23S rRNA pseudouridine1911/1915/1917 synthase
LRNSFAEKILYPPGLPGSGKNNVLEPRITHSPEFSQTFIITPCEVGQRLDHFLAGKLAEHSRSALSKLISAAHVQVNGQRVKAGHRLRANDAVSLSMPAPSPQEIVPEHVDFTVLFEDTHLLIVNKPPGLVVHPAGGHQSGTLVHGLLHRCAGLPAADAQRPGIVHRLDKDTSGILLVAKTELALRTLMADFKNRKISKTYHALLVRSPGERQGRVVQPVGRHPVDRKKMAICPVQGKYAVTNWRILEQYANGWCWVEIDIETGRTHQIRVHMSSIRAPIAGDVLYGGAVGRHAPCQPKRQMLHASTLRFSHPFSGQMLSVTAPLFADMEMLLNDLRATHP